VDLRQIEPRRVYIYMQCWSPLAKLDRLGVTLMLMVLFLCVFMRKYIVHSVGTVLFHMLVHPLNPERVEGVNCPNSAHPRI
jgi:hypothetical protein